MRAAAADELLVLSSAVHGASRDAAARLMRLARARIAAHSGSPASRTPVTEQDWSQVTKRLFLSDINRHVMADLI